MKSVPDVAGEARRAWLCELQSSQSARETQTPPQSDFEKSAVWRGVFIAAFIAIVINIPVSPAPAPLAIQPAYVHVMV